MTSPYLLPEGNVQIAFSGGRTSGYMLRKLVDANPDVSALTDRRWDPLSRVQVAFQNTGKERPETLDFVSEVSERWSVPVVMLEFRPPKSALNPFDDVELAQKYAEIFGERRMHYMADWWHTQATDDRFAIVNHNSLSRSGEPFEALLLRKKYLPNQQQRFCSVELKTLTAKRSLMSLGWKHWTNCVGLRYDEQHRLDKPPPKDRWTVWTPLATAGVSKRHVQQFWNMQPFDLRLPNVNGKCWLGNCDGCFLKAEMHIATFAREYPQDALWWEKWEEFGSWLTNSSSAAFWSKRYTRASMREVMERQGDMLLGVDGAFCQKDEGECAPL